jgi:hypothetical protein
MAGQRCKENAGHHVFEEVSQLIVTKVYQKMLAFRR